MKQTFKAVISNNTMYILPVDWHLAWEGVLWAGRPSRWVSWLLVKVNWEAILKGLWAKFTGKSFKSFSIHWIPQYLCLSVPSTTFTSAILLKDVQIQYLQKRVFLCLSHRAEECEKRRSPKKLHGNQMLCILKKNPLPFRFWENKK